MSHIHVYNNDKLSATVIGDIVEIPFLETTGVEIGRLRIVKEGYGFRIEVPGFGWPDAPGRAEAPIFIDFFYLMWEYISGCIAHMKAGEAQTELDKEASDKLAIHIWAEGEYDEASAVFRYSRIEEEDDGECN